FFFQAEDGIRDRNVTGVQTCALPISSVTSEERDEHGGRVAAERVGEADPGAVDLARAGVVTELRDDLGDLGGAGGADRMALGLRSEERRVGKEGRARWWRWH